MWARMRILRAGRGLARLSTIPGTMHHKVIDEGGYEKDITVGSALILDNVSVFTPKPSMYYLNITMRNVVKVFCNDTVLRSGSGVGGSGMLMEEEEIVNLMEEEEMVDLEFLFNSMDTFEILDQLTEFADSSCLQDRMKVWFVQKRVEEEAFAGFLRDQCAGLWMTNNKNQMLIAELEVLGERRDVDCGEGCVMSTQEYIKKVVEDVGEDEDFKSRSWVRATNQVLYFECDWRSCSDSKKDLVRPIPEQHTHKVIDDGGYGKDIVVRSALILDNVLVFTPKPSMYYLNIRMRNVVKVFHKDMVLGSGSGVGGSEMLMEEEEIVKLMEEE
ncbi:hypothetical protein Tco_0799866 [Tanacetum coccineum]|uniref:Homologous recombination OB-fold protein OB-fold domain-containing protein n=1 Tax=Tanacetum coccineum TaxID=301880 RepID=A0ABQ4ZVN2_9ASTR